MLPRPDLARLGVHYRRIPVLAIGKDIYLDTRLQLSRLESLFPSIPQLSGAAANPNGELIEALLQKYVNDTGIFMRAAQLIPTNSPAIKSPAFLKDRSDLMGAPFTKEFLEKLRPDALVAIQAMFDFLENVLLKDGRTWALDTSAPSLADVEAVWLVIWLISMPTALPAEKFSEKFYPRVYKWVANFQGALADAEKRLGEPETLKGDRAAEKIWNTTGWVDGEDMHVDEEDEVAKKLGLKKGDVVKVWSTDSGSAHKDTGKLVAFNSGEIVIGVKEGKEMIRIHAPRHKFAVKKVEGEDASRL